MAGEIEEPFGLDFRQVDSLHSGSISFGRFESEALCWEKRSSFSHNRYLEEVEKCSKPGSVTEKKAYFEAHFRKKAFLVLSSPECRNETDYQTSENGISEKMCNAEEIDHTNASTRSAQFDESLDGSVYEGGHEVTECETEVFGTSFPEPQFEHASDSTSNVDCVPQHVKVEEAINSKSGMEMKENLDCETADLDTSHKSNMAIGLSPDNYANEENPNASPKYQQSSSPKEKIPSKSEHIKPRLVPRVSVGRSRIYTSGNTSKSSENKANNKVRNVPVRSKAEKKTSEEPNKCLMHKTTKYERGSKTKGVDEIYSAEKEPRNRTIVEPQSSTAQKVSSRAYQSANRVKPAVDVTKPGTRQDISRFSFKSNEHSQRRKEEKPQAEVKQLRKSLSFKAIPMPSFYGGDLYVPHGNKAMASNIEPRKQRTKSSIPATRLSKSSPLSTKAGINQATLISAHAKTADPPQISGVTSCHSTVTSDSSASSPAGTRKDQPLQGGTSPISRKKEPKKEKLTSLRKHKVPEDNQFHKGKTFDGKQKTRTGRSTYASFNSSSRAGHMAVGVAS